MTISAQHRSARQIILTSNQESDAVALNELRAVDAGLRLLEWLEPGVAWVELSRDWSALVEGLRRRPPIFCRHICPVQADLPLEQAPADLDALAQVCEGLLAGLDVGRSFSVQTRLLGAGAWPYGNYDVNLRLADMARATGAVLDVRRPAQVLSVALTATHGYLGLSPAAENLSDWAGGARRFKREAGQISRAEFKLLEALELFQLRLPAHGTALDLGAAPGGWTRVLVEHSMQVMAVDPADLHPQLKAHPAVQHIRRVAQAYLPAAQQFDVILDDMRMDARASAHIMALAAGSLKPGGWALVTLKLPHQGMDKVALAALDLLRRHYTIAGARQLFHNRLEITVALKGIALPPG